MLVPCDMARSSSSTAPTTSTELMTAMTRLRARLRSESTPGDLSWTWSQLAALARISEDGPTTTTDLAQAEHVRRQSMAETVAALYAGGLVQSRPDPTDGRKILLTATLRGRKLIETIPAARQEWLDGAIEAILDPAERQILRKAAAIMSRLADADIPPNTRR